MKLRGDEVLTILSEAALENAQIDKAVAAMGIAQNLKNEEKAIVARGGGSKSVQMGLEQAARQGLFAGSSKTKVRHLRCRLTWNVSFATERETIIAAARNAWHMMGEFRKRTGRLQIQVKRSRQPYKASFCWVHALLCARSEASQKMNSSRWTHARTGWRDCSLQYEEKLGQ